MLGILVGMDQKDSLQRHSGRAFRRLRQCMCKAGIAGFLSPVMCSFPWLASPDARHHGRYGTEGLLHVDTVVDAPVMHAVQVPVVIFPVVAQRQIPMIRLFSRP